MRDAVSWEEGQEERHCAAEETSPGRLRDEQKKSASFRREGCG